MSTDSEAVEGRSDSPDVPKREEPRPPAQLRYFYWGCGLAACALYLVFIWQSSFIFEGKRFFSLFDDAMISMRYAKNMADGFGPQWNHHGQPVEGYTCFLYMSLMALAHLLPISMAKTSLVISLAGAVILLLNLHVVRRLGEQIAGPGSPAPLVGVLLTAFCYPLVYWTLRGLEVGLLCLLINFAAWRVFRLMENWSAKDVLLAGLAMSAAVLTRTDAVIPAGIIGMFLVYLAFARGFKLSILLFPMLIGLVMFGHTAFRLAYYGDALPNTYYLKITGVTLGERVARGLEMLWRVTCVNLWPVLVLLLVGAIAGFRKFALPKIALLLGLVLGQFAFSVYAGGDAWEWFHFPNRYLSVGLPIAFVLLSLVMTPSAAPGRETAVVVLPLLGAGFCVQALCCGYGNFAIVPGCLILAGALWVFRQHRRRQLDAAGCGTLAALSLCYIVNCVPVSDWLIHRLSGYFIDDDANNIRIGLLLHRSTPPNARIAFVKAGAAAYFAEREAIDLLGKCDPVVARAAPVVPFYPGHNKWNYRYSIGELKPDLVVTLWKATPADETRMTEWGYTKTKNGFYIRKGGLAEVAQGL